MARIYNLLFGTPLASAEDSVQKISPAAGIPIFGLDALGSAAYGPEAALTILLVLGAASTRYIVPLSAAIIALLSIVYLSYRQTIEAYPSGGGSYTVASSNLGLHTGLVAAAALMVDYILVVAVGIAAGVGALVSALPRLQPHSLLICLGILIVITIVNLRGVRDTGLAFMMPTYGFIATLTTVIVIGVVKSILHGGHPVPVAAPALLGRPGEAMSLWLLLRAFSSGCTAMTGVEAVSNGVTAFREPRVKTAQRTLTIIIGVLMLLLAGIAYLCSAYHIGATVPSGAGYQSVLSQLVGAVIGRGFFYYVTIGCILLVLSLQANTAFADFPRLCHSIADQGYLPHSFTQRGRRLVYSQGILVLALLSAGLLVLFGGVTDRLIPLFALGAFLAFTLSQAGMVVHWKRVGGRHSRTALAINALGALVTGLTVVVVAVSKFAEGAWITLLVLPALVSIMLAARRHKDRTEREIADLSPLSLDQLSPLLVVFPIERWTRVSQKTFRFALMLSNDIIGLHVDTGQQRGEIQQNWPRVVEEPMRKAGLPIPRLEVVQSPYRFIVTPILRFVIDLQRRYPERQIAVVVPEIVEKHWWQFFFHQHRGRLLSLLLIFRGNQRISVVNVPWHLHIERRSHVRAPQSIPERAA